MFALQTRYELGVPVDHKFQRLQELLEDLRTRDVKQNRTKELAKEVLDILKRHNPFHLLRCEPPTPEDMSYQEFWTAPQADVQTRIVTPMVALINLRKLADRPGLRSLWALNDTAWIRTFEWIEYLLVFPHRHETDLMDPADRQALVLSHVAPSLQRIVEVLHELSNAHLESILLIPEARAPEILVDMWLKWRTTALTLDRPGGAFLRANLRFTNDCASGAKGEKVRQLFVQELLRINFHLPRRIYCEMTYQVASLLHRSTDPELEEEIWALHTTMMVSLIELPVLRATGHPQRMTKTLTQGLFMALLQPRKSYVLKGLFKVLHTICRLSTNARAITCAIRHRIFYILIQLEKLKVVNVQPMFDLVAGALVTPAALKAFHNSLRLVSHTDRQSLRDKVAHIIVTYAERYKLIEGWEKEWPDIQTCRRRDCPNPESTDLRACPCGEVLFCSKECQRANWTDGHHSTVCWDDKDTAGSLSAKKLSFLISIARMYLEKNQSEIKRRLGDAYNPHHTVTLSLVDITLEQERWMNPFSVPGPYPDAPQTFFMAVHFMQGARRCARVFQFFPDWWAGKSRGMPYVQLSHSFFKTGLPVEEGLTPREHLFGRRAAEPRSGDAENEPSSQGQQPIEILELD